MSNQETRGKILKGLQEQFGMGAYESVTFCEKNPVAYVKAMRGESTIDEAVLAIGNSWKEDVAAKKAARDEKQARDESARANAEKLKADADAAADKAREETMAAGLEGDSPPPEPDPTRDEVVSEDMAAETGGDQPSSADSPSPEEETSDPRD